MLVLPIAPIYVEPLKGLTDAKEEDKISKKDVLAVIELNQMLRKENEELKSKVENLTTLYEKAIGLPPRKKSGKGQSERVDPKAW